MFTAISIKKKKIFTDIGASFIPFIKQFQTFHSFMLLISDYIHLLRWLSTN